MEKQVEMMYRQAIKSASAQAKNATDEMGYYIELFNDTGEASSHVENVKDALNAVHRVMTALVRATSDESVTTPARLVRRIARKGRNCADGLMDVHRQLATQGSDGEEQAAMGKMNSSLRIMAHMTKEAVAYMKKDQIGLLTVRAEYVYDIYDDFNKAYDEAENAIAYAKKKAEDAKIENMMMEWKGA